MLHPTVMRMPSSRGGQDNASWIAFLRERVAQAWRLARGIHNDEASKRLTAYAQELEANLQKLEAQAAVAKQAASEAAQAAAPEEAVAALKPPPDPEAKN